MDAEDARTFLRQVTDELIEMAGQAKEGQRNHAAVQAVAYVSGAGHALTVAAGLPPEAVGAARLAAVEALADLGYMDRGQANWMGARTGSRFAMLPEHDRQAERPAVSMVGPRLVRVVPLGVEVGPDHAGAVTLLTSLELYEDRLLAWYSRVGGDPACDHPTMLSSGLSSWLVKDDTGQELNLGGMSGGGPLPFETGTIIWTPAPSPEATSLFVTVQTAAGPELLTLPLGG